MNMFHALLKGVSPMTLRTQNQRAAFLMHGSRVTAMQRDVVQWNLTAIDTHNKDTQGAYLAPLLTLKSGVDNWNNLTSDLSVEEIEDLNKAKIALENY